MLRIVCREYVSRLFQQAVAKQREQARSIVFTHGIHPPSPALAKTGAQPEDVSFFVVCCRAGSTDED
jgi:hypothetical protein